MDTEVLNALTDCKAIKQPDDSVGPCYYWRERIGKCIIPSDTKCPVGVPRPRQDVAILEYRSLT